MKLKLLVAPDNNEVWYAVPRELEQAILTFSPIIKYPHRSPALSKMVTRIYYWAYKTNLLHQRQLFPVPKKQGTNYLSVLVGDAFQRCIPYFLNTTCNSIYLFDAWPQSLDIIDYFTTQLNITTVFFSIRQASEAFKKRRKDVTSIWLPEGTTPGEYKFSDYEDKDIDVLEFGRKNDAFHREITAPLHHKQVHHLYEKVKGEVIFQTREGFISGLARSKISICFPANITHPGRSGNYETVTSRYFSSMASKCLVLGHAPEEMKALFDYDPIIPVDMKDPAGQICNILQNFERYIPLIEKNYENVIKNHTWANRVQVMNNYLFSA
jgi:hypothetical protein